MVTAVVAKLRRLRPGIRITLITHHPEDALSYEHLGTETVCLQGYFSKTRSRAAQVELNDLVVESSDFVLLGADIIDGRYSLSRSFRRLLLARMAERAGLNVFVVGFSFSHNARPEIVSYLQTECQAFHYLCRDPLSANRMSEILERHIGYGADLAFGLPVLENFLTVAAQKAEQKIYAWREENMKVLAFNANPLGLESAMPGVDLSEAARSYADTLVAIAREEKCGFLGLTHDNRPAHSDSRLMQEIEELLPPHIDFHFLHETVRAQDIKKLCGMVDIVVTGRMHLGIAALGAGTTTMILDFQGKVRGLSELFNIPTIALDITTVLRSDLYSSSVLKALETFEETSLNVRDRLPDIYALSDQNMHLISSAWGPSSYSQK